MGGVREGEKTSHHAEQDRPNRFPCGAGRSDQKVASSVGLWLEAAPLRPPPASRRVLSWGSGLCTFPAVVGGYKRAVGRCSGLCPRPCCTLRSCRGQSLPKQRASYTLPALLHHALRAPTVLQYAAGFWPEMFTRSHPQNVSLKWLRYQQDNGKAKHGEDSAWFSAWWVRKG